MTKNPILNIVLIEPEIPQNTGNIGRLTLAANAHLHLVKPFGFKIDDTKVKRAGLDYWQHVPITFYENKEAFFQQNKNQPMAFLSSHGKHTIYDLQFRPNHFLIFGKESIGLPKDIIQQNFEHTFHIPLHSDKVRSLNIANAVSIVVYEGLRQLSASIHS